MARPPPGLGKRVQYEQSCGVDEILRPTIVAVDGRRYRKVTEVEFGGRGQRGGGGRSGEEVEEGEGKRKVPAFVGELIVIVDHSVHYNVKYLY